MPHIHEKIDFCVEVFIVHNNKVLLRMHDKIKQWLSVGGHIELDEDPEQAAIREVKEETGLDIKLFGEKPFFEDQNYFSVRAPVFVGRHFMNDTHEHVVMVYFASCDTDVLEDSILEHEKGSEMKWVSKEELQNMNLSPNVLFYALRALEIFKQ